MYFPTLKKARLVKLYRLGDYLCFLLTDCESLGAIQYEHVLYVNPQGEKRPCFAVASERNSMKAQLGGGSHFLGVFPGSGHSNMGASDEWANLDLFTSRALEVVAQHFSIEDEPIELPVPDDGEPPVPTTNDDMPFSLN